MHVERLDSICLSNRCSGIGRPGRGELGGYGEGAVHGHAPGRLRRGGDSTRRVRHLDGRCGWTDAGEGYGPQETTDVILRWPLPSILHYLRGHHRLHCLSLSRLAMVGMLNAKEMIRRRDECGQTRARAIAFGSLRLERHGDPFHMALTSKKSSILPDRHF